MMHFIDCPNEGSEYPAEIKRFPARGGGREEPNEPYREALMDGNV